MKDKNIIEQIQFIGLNELDPMDQEKTQKLATEYFEKFKRKIPGETNLVVQIKQSDKGGKIKYSVHSRMSLPSKLLESHADDWELAKALHIAFDDLLKEIQHRFHNDISRPCC